MSGGYVTYIIGALAGAAYGSLIGFVKYAVLWKKMLGSDKNITMPALYRHIIISSIINAASLLLIFLLRNVIPCDFVATIIAAAVMLSLVGKLTPVREIVDQVEEKTE